VTARQPRLLYPGTKVTAIFGGHTVYGVVDDYEHYHPTQTTFPVKFGRTTKIMTADDVTIERDQGDDRQPPRCTMLIERCTIPGHTPVNR
jgi:hypothetical protein